MNEYLKCTCRGSGLRFITDVNGKKIHTECVCRIESTARLRYGRLYTSVKNWIDGKELQSKLKIYSNQSFAEVLDESTRAKICPMLYIFSKRNVPWLMLRVDEIFEISFGNHLVYENEEVLKAAIRDTKYFILILPMTMKSHDYGLNGIVNIMDYHKGAGKPLWVFYETPSYNKNLDISEKVYGSYVTKYVEDLKNKANELKKLYRVI